MWVHHVYWVALIWVYTAQGVLTQLGRSQPAGIRRFSSQIGWKSSSVLRLEQILVNLVAQWILLGSMLVCDGDQHLFLLVHEEMKKSQWGEMSMKLSLFPGEGKGYPLQYSGLENSMAFTVHGRKELLFCVFQEHEIPCSWKKLNNSECSPMTTHNNKCYANTSGKVT